jgi:uncharacterized protein (TIGR02145 family)
VNCTKCKAEWTPPAGRTITNCPYCGEVIFAATLSGKDVALHEMLHSIVEQFGREILGETRLRGWISDLMPYAEKKHLRILKQAVNDGIGAKLLEMDSDTFAVRTLKISSLKETFKNNNGFTNTADYVVECFMFALGWLKKSPVEKQENSLLHNMNILEHAAEMAFSDGKLTKEEAKSLFDLGDKLELPEREVEDVVKLYIDLYELKPDVPPGSNAVVTKDFIISQDWIVKKPEVIEEKAGESKIQFVKAVPILKGAANVFKSDRTGNLYCRWKSDNSFIGMLAKDFDRSKPAFIITVVDSETQETWDYVGNYPKKENYESIEIGNQIWMKRNLNVSYFRNGDPIPEAKTSEEWEKAGKEGKPAWCYYDNEPENGKIYGKLYNWYAVNDPRGLSPVGWHVPSDGEWQELADNLGGKAVAGGKMKTIGATHWVSANEGATNSSGFSGLPGGYRYLNGDFDYLGYYGHWWSSTEGSSTIAWYRFLYYYSAGAGRYINSKELGFSVRCVRDTDVNEYNLPKPDPAKTIESVTIGDQIWMKRNLDVSHFCNGEPIPEIKTGFEWMLADRGNKPAWCYYGNDPENGEIYGKLYNWHAVNDPRGLAPEGWRVPSDNEWVTLINYLGGKEFAGGKMKTTGTTRWSKPNVGASNSSGFSGLPGGFCFNTGFFNGMGTHGYWWTSSDIIGTKALYRYLKFNNADAYSYWDYKGMGLSVRCVRDNDY